MKRGVLVVVALLALASVMAAMAYNSATVTSAAQLKVVSTDQALLGLELPNGQGGVVGTKDATVTVEEGELVFRLGKGVGRDGSSPVFYGLQPNSVYEWTPLFTIRNKSAETLDLTIEVTGSFKDYVTLGNMGQVGGGVHNPIWGAQGQPLTITNVTKESGSGMQNLRSIAVKVSIPKGHDLSNDPLEGTIVVKAVAK